MSATHAERKLAAIVSADVFGYSRLMAEDEEATIRTIRAYREQVTALVREHRGRLADFSGDNFLAEFPAALGAVECAVEIQRVLRARNASLPEARRMEFRIGVHMGDVRVDGERLFGDGVNIAARLEGLAQPGGICISATVHEQVRNHLGVAFDDLGDRSVKNVPDQIHVYGVRLEEGAVSREASRSVPRIALASLALLAGLALAVWAAWPRLVRLGVDLAGVVPSDAPALPDIPSIVVLPFANMSGDPEQEYFADGITEDLTTALSGTSALFVISRNSAFTYKGRTVKVEDVGRELGVRYVLEGSVRRAGDDVRITAQLIDATTGFHVWSERWDRRLEGIFALQSEISERILGAVGAEISEAELERIRRKPTESQTAYDAFARGLQNFYRFTREGHAEARRWVERAIEIDPSYAAAVALRGSIESSSYGLLWSLDRGGLEHAEGFARRAIELDPGLALPYITLASLEIMNGRFDAGLREAERARAKAPSDATSYLFTAVALGQLGRPLEALAATEQGLRRNPRLGNLPTYTGLVGGLYANTGRMDEAVDLWQQARAANPDLIMLRLDLADHFVESGDLVEAQALIQEVLRVQPELTVDHVLLAGIGSRRVDREQRARHLRAAGLP